MELYACRVTATDLPRLETHYLACLHPEEQARYRLFTSVRRGLEWLAGRALALESLAAVLGRVKAGALRTAGGGGLVYQDAALRLSLSHSCGMLALVVATASVGVDVERVRARSLAAHAEAVFAPEEAAHLAQAADNQCLRLFYQYWTLKEATCKAAGISIWQGLTAAQFDLRFPQRFKPAGSLPAGSWRFWSANIDGHWQLAVAEHGVPSVAAFTAWRITLPGLREKLQLDALSSFVSS